MRAMGLVVLLLCGCAQPESEPPVEPPPPEGGCAAGETAVGDACVPAGVPADGCAPGFVSDGNNGCNAVLPATPCMAGQLAQLGETECHSVAACGDPPWGDIPTDTTTEHVDRSYTGGANDGSAAHPWTTIQAALDAAQPGAIVAVAEGTYTEDVDIAGSPARLWGRCPELVQVTGQGNPGAINVGAGASQSEVRGLAVRGPQSGIVISGAADVSVDEVWVHDTGKAGIVSISVFGMSSANISSSLIEHVVDYGIFVIGTAASIDGVVVRDVLPLADGTRGHGIGLDLDETPGTRASVTINQSVVERAAGFGILVGRSDAVLTGVLVRDATPVTTEDLGGLGVVAYSIQTAGQRANLTMTGSVVERCQLTAVIVSGSDATIDTTVVRDTGPSPADSLYGFGFIAQQDPDTLESSTALVTRSLIERSHGCGVYVRESDATFDAFLVRGTQEQLAGNKVGDGMVVDAPNVPASAIVTASRFEANVRAGVAAVGAHFELGTSRFECNVVDLNGERTVAGTNYTFVDRGGNACGCSPDSGPCKVLSSGLEPPEGSPL